MDGEEGSFDEWGEGGGVVGADGALAFEDDGEGDAGEFEAFGFEFLRGEADGFWGFDGDTEPFPGPEAEQEDEDGDEDSGEHAGREYGAEMVVCQIRTGGGDVAVGRGICVGEEVPPPCKPDFVHPACAGLDGHFSHSAEAERPACAGCD